jgi:hypothetical protein
MPSDEAKDILEDASRKLGEHFDAIQILASWNEESLTKAMYRGSGNWYARQGMAHEFINADIAQDTAHKIADQLNKNDSDDGDDWKTGNTAP